MSTTHQHDLGRTLDLLATHGSISGDMLRFGPGAISEAALIALEMEDELSDDNPHKFASNLRVSALLTLIALSAGRLEDILAPITTELDALQKMSEARSSAADTNA